MSQSCSASPERPVFVAHQLCPPHLRQLIEDTVQSFNDAWLLPPVEGELFSSSKVCLARLHGFALSRGFAVVTTASGAGRYRFACIHHGADTKNWRKLEALVEKDSESDKVVSKRQREGTSKQAP
jgi:hypothetical protein